MAAAIVIKFGGTSVANKARWQNITKIVKQHIAQGKKPLVVCSAPSGVSNLLEQLVARFSSYESRDNLTLSATQQIKELETIFTNLVTELEVDLNTYLIQQFNKLRKLINGIELVGEATPRVQARVMAYGELMLTQIGAKYLESQDVNIYWQDARGWLRAEEAHDFRHPDAYLDAHCSHEADELIQQQFADIAADVVITQGFIASNPYAETVLLGRGGSDSSATYFACKLQAERCEIWTDVPGIYTANPKGIPQARMITNLEYDEAQEIASMGAKVLHPKCISPVRQNSIPISVRYTPDPDRPGTDISTQNHNQRAQIKSILTKHNIVLISIETMKMWHQVGFLAEVFVCFKKHGVSIDLISTSEASVTVSLDSATQEQQSQVLDRLVKDLNQFARAKVISPCASVSLVGRNIRAILHQLGDTFSVFEEQKIYLLSQAANDLNLTFVVDEDQAARLASKLHHLLIEQRQNGEPFRLSYAEEFGEQQAVDYHPWWQSEQANLIKMAEQHSPCYVYSQVRLQQAVDGLKACDAIDKIFYSMKANNNKAVLELFFKAGIGFECVSRQELEYLLQLFPTIDPKRISFTPNFASFSEYEFALQKNVHVTIDSLYPFLHWAEKCRGKQILIRVDIGQGSGHHKYVVTGGDRSKFGIPLAALDQVQLIAHKYDIEIVGLHSHSGSGISNPHHWQKVYTSLLQLTERFPNVRYINVGGGLGVVERASQKPLDLMALNKSLHEVKTLELWMEPGRYLVSEAGVLLAKVTQVKEKGELQFVGIETGMNSLIRPSLYGAYHEIVNLTRLHEPKTKRVNLVGPICESGDTLGYSRWLPECREGDVMLIATAGAYGHSMSSRYNLREPAVELVFD